MTDLEIYKRQYDYFFRKVKKEIGDIDAIYGLMGYAAPWAIDETIVLGGGAMQISTPFTGDSLEALGLLMKIK